MKSNFNPFIRTKFLTFIASFILVMMHFSASAQITVVMDAASDGMTFDGCSGVLFDSGGNGPNEYTNNENTTVTICPDVPGELMTLQWNLFALSTNDDDPNPNQQNLDYIYIWDGDVASGTPTLGFYSGSQLANLVVSATSMNPTGCLTVQFISNTIGTGQYAAQISCQAPCDPPEAVGEIVDADNAAGDSIATCVGDLVEFTGYGIPGPGFSIDNIRWDFGDGTEDNTNSGTVQHAYTNPGHYIVELFTTDDNGCDNINLISLQVYVSTYPTFDPFSGDTTVCLMNGEFSLYAYPQVYAETWVDSPLSVYVEDNCMTDDVGVLQTTPMFVSGFPAGEILDDISDIVSICVDIEHSFMGDFVLELVCPDGSIMTLHQQGGGGTFLGVPIDNTIDCDDPSTFGEAWTYCFTPEATETWVQAAATVTTLPAGDYEPVEPFEPNGPGSFDDNDLYGCPINGVWTLNFTDLWGADDGSIPSFAINLDPDLYPDLVSFTPVIGQLSDSSFWDPSGVDITSISSNGNVVTIDPQSQGQFDYTYTITNNFGCTFDSTVTVTVNDFQVQGSVGGDGNPVFCDGTGVITASQVGNPGGLFVYIWSPSTGLSNPGQATTAVNLFQDTMTYTVTSYPLGMPGCASTDQVTVMLDPSIDAGQDADLWVCWNSGMLTLSEIYLNGTPDAGGVWTDAIGNVVTEFDPSLEINQVFTYTVTNTVTGCFKESELSVFVNPIGSAICCNFDVYSDTLSASCAGYADGYIEVWVDGLGEPGPFDFTFINQIGTPVVMTPLNSLAPDTIFNLTAGDYQVQISIPAPNYCPIYDTITVNEPNAILTNPFADTSICIGGVAYLSAYASGGNGGFIHHWTTPQGTTFDTYPNDIVVVDTLTADPTVYTVITEDANNCLSNPKYPKVDIFPPISITMKNDTQICVNTPLILHPTNVTGGAYTTGNKYDVYTFFWFDENGVALPISGDSLSLIPTEEAWYYLNVIDTCSTPMKLDSIYVHFYTQPNTAFTSDTISGCYPTGIQFINLTDPNLLAGSTWNFGDGETSTDDDPYHVYDGIGYYSVSLNVVSPDGCYQDTLMYNYIRSNGYPTASFEYYPNHPTMLNPEVNFVNLSYDNLTNYWEFEEGDPSIGTSTEENPVFSFPNTGPGMYSVYLQVSNETYCVHDTVVNVEVFEDFLVYIPNSFTPDGDGYNDVFGPQGTDMNPNDYSIQIFDRWGQVVFETTNLDEPWNGMIKNTGKEAQDGVYVYRMVVRSATTYEKKEISGNITLIR